MSNDDVAAIILAAGQGTRMRSSLPKVLHPLLGLPMYAHVTRAVLEAGVRRVVLVVGHRREALIADVAERFDERVTTAVQERQLGTGDAARAGLEALAAFGGWVLVLFGDTPLLHVDLVRALISAAERAPGQLAMLTSQVSDPTGYGRILRGPDGAVRGIREHKDASPEERGICEVNPGVYAVRAAFLREALARLSDDNAQRELYFTDVVAQAAALGAVSTVTWPFEDTQGVNDRAQLAHCETSLRLRRALALARSGVTVRDPQTTYVEMSAVVEPDAILEPNVHIRGASVIASGARIDTGCVLTDVRVARGAYLRPYTVATESVIGEDAQAGPFSHLRPESVMEAESHVGNFVELKKTRLGPRSKANHLAYLGDGDIGRDVNVGAGTIFCNYDGVQKHQTVLEDEVFIGSDSQLVAPIRVGKGAYVATGTTVTLDVPPDALAVGRARQTNKPAYAHRLRAKLKAQKEAANKR
jgi:bifunctional UDP-N-acetylglucosamine pyrophosphorylase/glucosamine-1-phosphate N-acetyltransferase